MQLLDMDKMFNANVFQLRRGHGSIAQRAIAEVMNHDRLSWGKEQVPIDRDTAQLLKPGIERFWMAPMPIEHVPFGKTTHVD